MSTSTSEEDVLRIKKKLEKMIKSNEIDVNLSIDMLNSLKKLQIDIEVLKNTGIGVVLNNLRKNCNSEELGLLAKSLLKCWKKIVSNENLSNSISPKSPNRAINDSNSSPTTTSQQINNNALINSSESDLNSCSKEHNSSYLHQAKKRGLKFSETNDPVRIKSRQLLSQALETNEPFEYDYELYDCQELAAQIEDAIFIEFKNTELKYKNRVRSRIANLKDPKNPKLRESVRLGIITADRLAKMSSEELASDELKELRAKFTKESINDHQMARTDGAKSSLLSCGKCKKNNVTYTQMQTRSADEPMTTFAFCQECGHRWKFC
jgi:transcription elongation factor S-II